MQPRRRARSLAAPALTLCAGVALAAAAGPAAGVGGPAAAPRGAARGLQVVQYAATAAPPLPWVGRLLSSAPTLTTLTGPRASLDPRGGVQVAFRNPEGDAVLLDGTGSGRYRATDLSAATDVGDLEGVPVPTVLPGGVDAVVAIGQDGQLFLFGPSPFTRLNHPGMPHFGPWWATDLTSYGGPEVTGTPSVVVQGSNVAIFARTKNGHLIEYVNQPLLAKPWRAYDISAMALGPTISTDPAAYYDPQSEQVRVAAVELAPDPGHLVVFAPTDVGGRIWAAQDVSAATDTGALSGGVAAAVEGTTPLLVAPGQTGDLLEFAATDSGTTTTWSVVDLTSSVTGAPEVTGTPAIATDGTEVVVAASAASWGDLFEWTQQGASPPSVADVSLGGGAARTIAGTPAAVFAHGQPLLFGAGVSVPAPEGTGVYAIPSSKWSQAIEDGWPILGVTGGLGTQCAPWVGYVTPPAQGVTEPDLQVGLTIQQSHVRETWLSFWTISGPGTAPGPGCTKEKAPYTEATYFDHGYDAGRWVAAQVDAYRASGLGLKPDWVIFDPEGYPDDHSGLDGPTTPASALRKSIGDWDAMLRGWKQGLDAIDPTIKAAVYADQYEYTTYELGSQSLPVFIAGAFAQQDVAGHEQLVVPTRTAFGANILGFVMFNENFTPSCAQLDDEAQLLTEPPWDGDYNTVQTTPGDYCSPGAAAARLRALRDR